MKATEHPRPSGKRSYNGQQRCTVCTVHLQYKIFNNHRSTRCACDARKFLANRTFAKNLKISCDYQSLPEQHKLVGQRLTNGWPTLDNGRPTNLCCSGCAFILFGNIHLLNYLCRSKDSKKKLEFRTLIFLIITVCSRAHLNAIY